MQSFHCYQSETNSSICVYHNLICLKGNFYLEDKLVKILPGSFWESRTSDGNRWFPLTIDLNNFSFPHLLLLNETSVLFKSFYPKNIGHTILDSIYPIFLSLIKLNLYEQNFNSFISNCYGHILSIQSIFCGGNVFDFDKKNFPDMIINLLVVGSGRFDSRTIPMDGITPDYSLHSFQLFRDRMYKQYGIQPRNFTKDKYHGIIIANKRFTKQTELFLKSLQKPLHPRLTLAYYDLKNFPSYGDQ